LPSCYGRRRRPWHRHGSVGATLIEILVALACAAALAALVVSQARAGVDEMRTLAAARDVAARMALARTQATTLGRSVAIRVVTSNGHSALGVYADGNHNGVRQADIASGVDPMLAAPIDFEQLHPGVALAMAPTSSALYVFTPEGTATSGTIEVHGLHARFAVRVLGVTARTRIVRYDPAIGAWNDTW
jgi:Tfp pilus assembly protein FimT